MAEQETDGSLSPALSDSWCFNTHTDLGPVCINPSDLWLNLSRFRRAYPLPPSPHSSTIHIQACTLTLTAHSALRHCSCMFLEQHHMTHPVTCMMHLNWFPFQRTSYLWHQWLIIATVNLHKFKFTLTIKLYIYSLYCICDHEWMNELGLPLTKEFSSRLVFVHLSH